MINLLLTFRIGLLLALSPCFGATLATHEPSSVDAKSGNTTARNEAPVDRSGKKRKGNASYYNRKFAGKTMADGTRMNPESNVAASKTLPLGTKAKVTNLHNGKSAQVVIKDRGPYVKGRIVDVSPKTAKDLGLAKEGVAPVEVAPITVPQPDGTVKPGDASKATRDRDGDAF